MHEYRDSLICREMRALRSGVAEVDQHIGFLVSGVVPERGNWNSVVILNPHALGENGEHDTLIPAVLGGTAFNYVVYVLMVRPQYTEKQLHYFRLARQRYDGRCLARALQSPYKAMVNFGDGDFQYIVVMPDVDFDKVRDYCEHYLRKDGILIVAQRGSAIDVGNMNEAWKKYLKNTAAGYCIETEKEGAEWTVVGLMKK